jgi:shikimate dehydrogenase
MSGFRSDRQDGGTLKVALIGWPLRRRHSQVMHDAAFAHFGIDARYELRALLREQVEGFFDEVRGDGWLGFQVTAPYKEMALRHCDHVEEEAMVVGAVNAGVRSDGGRLTGFNTDLVGFVSAVVADLGRPLRGAAVAVAGAGGAARAVVAGSLRAGAASVVVGNRDPARAEQLMSEMDDDRVGAVGLVDFAAVLENSDIAVNATTVGMTQPGVPFDVAALPDGAAVFDLVYVPAETELLRSARRRGLDAANGLGMLVAQGAAAFERWTGLTEAAPVMAAALQGLGEEGA